MRGTISVPFQYGSGSLLQCAAPLQYGSGPLLQRAVRTARALYDNARYRLGTASVPLGPSITMRGTASVPLGPSITLRGICVFQSFNWVGVKNFQENTKTNTNKTQP